MIRSLPALAFVGCSSLVVEGFPVPAWEGVTYIGERDPVDVGIALTAWAGELHRLTGETAQLGSLVIDERPNVRGDGYVVPGRATIDVDETSPALMMHEGTHEHLRITQGDPDRDHGASRGPWTELHDRAIERAVARVEGGRCE